MVPTSRARTLETGGDTSSSSWAISDCRSPVSVLACPMSMPSSSASAWSVAVLSVGVVSRGIVTTVPVPGIEPGSADHGTGYW